VKKSTNQFEFVDAPNAVETGGSCEEDDGEIGINRIVFHRVRKKMQKA
jgi:hypothetical protein